MKASLHRDHGLFIHFCDISTLNAQCNHPLLLHNINVNMYSQSIAIKIIITLTLVIIDKFIS